MTLFIYHIPNAIFVFVFDGFTAAELTAARVGLG
jgi:uncharacterized membrane protein